MLTFGSNELEWGQIASFGCDNGEVTVTTTDSVTLVIGTYSDVQAANVYGFLSYAKAAFDDGGVTIEIIIDDL